jgi:hypothetical protein
MTVRFGAEEAEGDIAGTGNHGGGGAFPIGNYFEDALAIRQRE